jgi:hypothetical protein
MLQLVYSSVASDGGSDIDLTALCEKAARNNKRDEITGVLLLRDGYFLQALEGPRLAVEDAFLRIIADDRHGNLQLLSRRIVTARHFGDFAMAKAGNDGEQRDTIDHVRELLTEAPENWRLLFEDRFAA